MEASVPVPVHCGLRIHLLREQVAANEVNQIEEDDEAQTIYHNCGFYH